MMPRYDDGLDDDGYAVTEPWRKPYVHGSEAEAGDDFRPTSLGSALIDVFKRAEMCLSIGNNTESPIELQLGAAILIVFERNRRSLQMCVPSELESATGLVLVPQYGWGFYRSDWALYNPRTGGALLIECDGAEFHSSPEQKLHDQKKDAAAHDRGCLTIRFTGSQIHRSADGCAQKIFDIVYGGDCGAHS
jgi:very-short-patch-repair endonuclease